MIDCKRLVAEWSGYMTELCSGALDDDRIEAILDNVLCDDDDPVEFLLTKVHNPNSPNLTPVERLLLLVRVVRAGVSGGDASRTASGRSEYDTLRNLRQLLWIALHPKDRPRAFSSVERAELCEVWGSLDRACDFANPDETQRGVAARQEEMRLHRFTEAVETIQGSGTEVDWLRAWLCYREAQHFLHGDQPDATKAADRFEQLFLRPCHVVPNGRYFLAAHTCLCAGRRGRGRLDSASLKVLLSSVRQSLAQAVALLPPHRVLDRLGAISFLAWDACAIGALQVARLFADAAQQVEQDANPSRWPLATRRKVANLHSALRQQINDLASAERRTPVDSISEYHHLLPTSFKTKVLSNPPEALHLLNEAAVSKSDAAEKLYLQIVAAWFQSRTEPTVPNVAANPTFLDHLSTFFESERRSDLAACRLIALGLLTRALNARSRQDIDRTVEEYDRFMSVLVLGCNWKALADTLQSEGHLNFLINQLGFDNQATHLVELGDYFRRVLALPPRAKKGERQDLRRVDEELVGDFSRDAVHAVRDELFLIEESWRWKLAEVKGWAERCSYVGQPPRLNGPRSPSGRDLHKDMRQVTVAASFAMRLSTAMERLPFLRALAWSAHHFCNILRKPQRDRRSGDPGKPWLDRGIGWADEGISLAEKLEQRGMLYAMIEVRVRLEGAFGGRANRETRDRLRSRMLELEEQRLKTTRFAVRRHRSTIKTERTITEVMNAEWCRSFSEAVEPSRVSWLPFLEQVKTFHYGQLVRDERENVANADDAGDETLDPAEAYTDVYEGAERYAPIDLPQDWDRILAQHLEEQRAAVLEFVTHPRGGTMTWEEEVARRFNGTVCLVFRSVGDQLRVRPVYLCAPESLIELVVSGDSDFQGLKSTLPKWPTQPPLRFPKVVGALGKHLFSDELVTELRDIDRLYLCPHRHLFQVPIHALPLSDGSYPFMRWDISYGIKVAHLVSLLRRGTGTKATGSRDLWGLADVGEFGVATDPLARWLAEANHWEEGDLDIEKILFRGSEARRALFYCHGQMDDLRPGRARLRLWGGGRLTSDDIHRVSNAVDFGQSDWTIAACDAGSTRVGMQTAPGIGLSFVTAGARRVTTCLYKVDPRDASEFIAQVFRSTEAGDPSPYTAACRSVTGNVGTMSGWAKAASFVSYGLFHAS